MSGTGKRGNVVNLGWFHGDLSQDHHIVLVMLWNKGVKEIIGIVELNFPAQGPLKFVDSFVITSGLYTT